MNLSSGNFYKPRGAERLHMTYRSVAILAGALIVAAPLGTPAHAQVAGAPSTFTFSASLSEWMSHYQIPAASVAIMKDGRLVSTSSLGGLNAATPTRIASLSKAITGVCVGHLVDAGRLSFTTPLGSVLARTFTRLGQPADPRFRSITVEQLLTHRAGLPREALPGPRPRGPVGAFMNVLATPLTDNPGAGMVYSNIGYMTLGLVVEAVTGSDYEHYCRNVALTPMQASGSIDPQLRPRAAAAGWRVSAIDYARFIQVFEPGSAALGPLARAWQDALPGPRAYGLGIGIRRTPKGVLLRHTGRSGHRDRGGAYVVKFPSGWTAVVTFAGDPRAAGRGGAAELHRRLAATITSL
jgi:CubicO group peptidase (beta-lactamase class C family)